VANFQQPVDFPGRILIGGIHVGERGLCKPMRLGIRFRHRARCRCDVVTVDPSFATALVDYEVGAVRIENLERAKSLGQQLVPPALRAEVDQGLSWIHPRGLYPCIISVSTSVTSRGRISQMHYEKRR